MKQVVYTGVCFLILMGFSLNQGRASDDWAGNVNFNFGVKKLNKGDWAPVEEHAEFGVNMDFRGGDWPISIAMALIGSADDGEDHGADHDVTTSEFRLGFKKIWEPDKIVRPFLGCGFAVIEAERDIEYLGIKQSDDDTGPGIWVSGGFYWSLSGNFNAGFEIGYSTAKVTVFDQDIDAGGGHATLMVGYHR